ncbi:unnamed protein product [Linum tenue]|uniref:Rubredoxin-like domain-containing protein n=2 Tax=Linum tenue TaxID=586396 RepID=A0AAV0MKL3_9ROSI|nr:unnamed protein product [Linum tenue]
MALQLQSTRLQASGPSSPCLSSLSPSPQNAGLRPPPDRFALKSSFFSPSLHLFTASLRHLPIASAAPKFSMRVASKQAYICRDCGYIYNDKTPFGSFTFDCMALAVCGAPKRRFRPYTPAVTKGANDKDVRKARKAELQRDEAIGRALPIAVVVGIVALAALYFYLNNTFQG